MSRETPPGRPPRWARSPATLRSVGGVFPFRAPTPAEPREQPSSLGRAVTRLGVPLRITVLLMVVAPILDLLPLFTPPLWDQPGWWLAMARSLSGALMMPTAGALVLAVLAVTDGARPSSAPSAAAVQALIVTGALTLLAGVSVGVLAGALLQGPALAPPAQASLLWDTARALLITLANGATAWGVTRQRGRRDPALPLGPPRPLGIELLD